MNKLKSHYQTPLPQQGLGTRIGKLTHPVRHISTHGSVEERGNFKQLFHCITICTVQLLGVQLYVSFGGLKEEQNVILQ